MSPVFALVPAAGNSTRLGLGYSKALLKIGSLTVIQRTVSSLLACEEIEQVVVLVRKADMAGFKKLDLDWNRVCLAEGGQTRQGSVWAGLQFIGDRLKAMESAYVLVHDAARCFVSSDLIERCIEEARQHKAVTAAIPVVDSIKQIRDDFSVELSLPRDKLVAVQTPQVFSFDLLYQAHEIAQSRQKGRMIATDDASLVEAIHPVHVVKGERSNIKVTTPEDLALAKVLAGDSSLV